ncbi:hypothetical protein PSQ20_21780 [Curvibacter sp. RS43]|uniref:hypothetical protein n=1 Tax=Curvibacter microcysteis TaxID=3026419 RepID=UPI00235E4310|nr:hypothetical protein [Curvibacter sp. RS43]MDD0812981.1 hypothetical protein [Curvibacter sp. RS43]
MTQAPYPLGDARSIAEARFKGMAPAQTVLISMVGRLPWPNPTVFVQADKRYRWDWLCGLGVVLLVNPECKLGGLLADIEVHRPSQLDVIDVDRRTGWLINWAIPGRIVSTRWPQAFVDDWLGSNSLHRELEGIKAQAAAEAKCKAQEAVIEAAFEVEVVWN